MNKIARYATFLVLILPVFLLGACTESPISPILGNGSTLNVLVDGVAVQFDIESSLSTYDTGNLFGTIAGATLTLPVKSMTLSFRGVDLDKDAFPKVLSGSEVNIVLVTSDSQGDDLTYITPASLSQNNSRITITASDGTTVDGEFSGTLVEADDPNDKIILSGGTFSAKLTRE